MAESSSATKEHAHKTPGPSASARTSAPDNQHEPEINPGAPEAGVIGRHAALVGDLRLGSATGAQRLRLVQRLQRGYGNAYVARLVQRAVAEPPVAAPATPQQDPKFVAVEQKIGQVAKQEKQHPPAKAKASEAQAAAQGPPNDIASQAAEKQVDKMSQQKPGEFDKKAFIAAVKKAIDASAPKNLEEADDFKKSGKAGQVKNEVSGMVGKGKQDSEGPIKKANTESPDTSSAKPKAVKPMGEEKPGAAPPDPGAAQAVPSPKSAAETSMAAGPAQVNQDMSQAGVTEEQLKNSNEPQFTDAVAAKQGAEEHSKTAPGDYKAAENETLDKAGADAKSAAGTTLTGMHGDKQAVLGAVGGQKGGAKSKDEAKRAEVASKIETIFNQTKTEVTTILDGLDGKVNTAFDAGEKEARAQFETYVDQKMTRYKADRYGGFFGGAKWLKDKLMGMPSEVNAFYADGRNLYLSKMEGVISNVADIVGGELGRAKARIALGKQQVKEFVASQPKELQQVAKDAEQQIGGKFDELEGEVNSKQDALVQTLADKYVAARGELDSRIDALKAENKGLVDKAIDAIGGVIKTIMQLKDMLLGVLAKAANVIGDIIKDPIKFLGNLVSAIKMGLNQFGANIEKHLKAALMGWLFGTLGEAGIKLPESFDLKGILSLILQVLGLTYENVRAIAVKIAGEKVVAFVEGTVTFFTTLAKEGPAGLWQWIKDKIAELNLKEVVLGAIKDFVITKIITAGITWLISMLNPAAAFIKACKMIYDVIMFIVERGSQIMEFVNSVLDGIGAIVACSLGSAATLVENSLAKVLPLAIAFLASLLGVGGIAEKIKDIIEKIRAPITKLITAVVGPILKPMKALYAKGQKFVKGLADKGKAALKKGVDKVKAKAGFGDKPEEKQKRLEKGVSAGKSAVEKLGGRRITTALMGPALSAVKVRYQLGVLEPVKQGKYWAVHGELQRMTLVTTQLTVKEMSRATRVALQKNHDRLGRLVNNDIAGLWKKKAITNKLATEPALKGELEKEKNDLDSAWKGNQPKFEGLMAGSPTEADVDPDALVAVYGHLTPTAEHVRDRLLDLTKSDAEKGKEAELVRNQIKSHRDRAASVMADAAVQKLLALSSFAGLKAELDKRRPDVDALIAADSGGKKQLAELRSDLVKADQLRQSADRAARNARFPDNVEPSVVQIDAICKNTTKAGREDADVGDGSSEVAAIQEVKTGAPVKEKMHGPKCRTEGAGLAGAITKLKELRSIAPDPSFVATIDIAIKKGEERKNALDRGAAAWANRVSTNPEMWNGDGGSKNPKYLGWGAGL